MCNCHSDGHMFEGAKLCDEVEKNYINYILYLLPVDFFEDIIMDVTNDKTEEYGGKPTSWRKFLRYICLWLLMSAVASMRDSC